MADIDAPLAWRMQQDGYLMQINQLRAENAKLCAEVERLHADQAHWELGNCPSCPNVVSLQEALEQNAKLRDKAAKFDKIYGSWKRLRSSVPHLRDENTKLRKLVDGFQFCGMKDTASSDDCIGCPLLDQSPHGYRCARDDRMRELGIEVPS